MKVKIIIAAMLLAIALTACGKNEEPNNEAQTAQAEEAVTEWPADLSVVMTEGNISYNVPSNWNATSSEDGKRTYYYPYEDMNDQYLCVSIQTVPEMSYDDYASVAATLSGESSVGQDYVAIADRKGYFVRFDRTSDGTRYDTLAYLLLDGDQLFYFLFAQPAALDANMTDLVKQFMGYVRPVGALINGDGTYTNPKASNTENANVSAYAEKSPEEETDNENVSDSSTGANDAETDSNSVSRENARKKAINYLTSMPFSKDGLASQLEFEGFSKEDAQWAAENCGADWNAQALKKGKAYLKTMPYSHEGLVEQLEYEGFTTQQAMYAADNLFNEESENSDLNSIASSGNSISAQNALERAKQYLEITALSYESLISQLEYEGYTKGDAVYAANSCGADWNEQAYKKAQSYLEISAFSRGGIISQLEYEGFSTEQATYAADKCGL